MNPIVWIYIQLRAFRNVELSEQSEIGGKPCQNDNRYVFYLVNSVAIRIVCLNDSLIKQKTICIHFLFLNELQRTFSQNVYFVISSISINSERTKHGLWNIENRKNLEENFWNIVFPIYIKNTTIHTNRRTQTRNTTHLYKFSQFYIILNETNSQSRYCGIHFYC